MALLLCMFINQSQISKRYVHSWLYVSLQFNKSILAAILRYHCPLLDGVAALFIGYLPWTNNICSPSLVCCCCDPNRTACVLGGVAGSATVPSAKHELFAFAGAVSDYFGAVASFTIVSSSDLPASAPLNFSIPSEWKAYMLVEHQLQHLQ